MVAAILVALTLLVFFVPGRFSQPIEDGVRTAMAPAQNLLAGLACRVRRTVSAVRGLGGMVQRNQELAEEIVRLQADDRAYETLERENRILRRQLHFYHKSSWELIPCEVIARDLSGWWKSIRINKGSRYGVEESCAVVSPDGLVGRTTSVASQTSEVLLISDPASRISVRLSRTGAFGVIEGGRGNSLGHPLCQMKFISKDVEVQSGDEVVTSGLGGVFPRGISIGYVEEVEFDRSGLYQSASVIPKASLEMLEFVFVVSARTESEGLPEGGGQ